MKEVKAHCGEFHLRFCGSPSCLLEHQLFIDVFYVKIVY